MELKEAINYILDGEGVLFTGAGASTSAININGENLKSLNELTTLLYKRCGMESDGNISYAIDEFLDKYGENELIQLLKEEYTIKEISREHEIIASVDWKRIYTTNYDNIIETAFHKQGKILTSVNLNDRPYHYKDKKQLAIHLNGEINRLNSETLNNSFKLTEPSYLSQDFKESEWISLFRQDMKTASVIIFIGFSLNNDLDLKRIIYSTPEITNKTFFILSQNEREATIRNIKRFGIPVEIGIERFSKQIEEQNKTFLKKVTIEKKYFCFKQPMLVNLPPDLTDKSFYALLQDGDINDKVLQYSLYSPEDYPYFVYREKLDSVLNSIKNGAKNILVTSDIGNGKTLFIKGLSFMLKNEGYGVFEYNKFYSTQGREIETICSLEGRNAIIIESYNHYNDVIEEIENLRSDIVLILTERSNLNDVTFYKLEKLLHSPIYFVDLNVLSDKEINEFVQLFDHYGYWGEKASDNYDKKFRFIANQGNGSCNRSIRLLLLKQLESNDILRRFQKVISTLQNKKNYHEALALILVSNVFNFTLQLEDLVYVLDDEILNDFSFRKNIAVREFVNFEEGRIKVRSSILSEAILRNVVSSHSLIDTLIKVCCRLDNRRDDKNTRIILKELISFSNLQSILKKDTSEYKFNILRFFEGIRNMQYCRKNPHYWLQYAIARLAEREYGLADKYFQSAYALSKKIDWFDTYQIDNHYARYLLENEIYYGALDTCMGQFLKAHKILANPNDKNKTRHYPFRVAQHYFPFYQKFFKDLPQKDKLVFLHSCEEIIMKVDVYLKSIDNYRIKGEVEKAKELILEILGQEKKLIT
ncbi:MAG: SIR2 family protein [Bacteroidales bacterium]|nr:SIR2 family protein [Bacteroidales bacterium]